MLCALTLYKTQLEAALVGVVVVVVLAVLAVMQVMPLSCLNSLEESLLVIISSFLSA